MKYSTEQIILGSMCGDGYINVGGTNPYFTETHSVKQKDYLLWKADMLKDLYAKTYRGVMRNYKRRTVYDIIRLYTSPSQKFMKYRSMFYSGMSGPKFITYDVLKLLEPLALAVWYLDDGTYNLRDGNVGISSSTNDINVQGDIKKYFEHDIGLDCGVVSRGNKQYSVVFTVKSSDKFLNMIREFVPSCMNYKLGHLIDDNKQLIADAKKKAADHQRIYLDTNKEYVSERAKQYHYGHYDWISERHKKNYIQQKMLKELYALAGVW